MQYYTRYMVAGVVGLGLTAALGLTMAGLIRVDFAPETKTETTSFEINPVIEDIKIIKGRTELQPYKAVEVPPAAPRLATDSSESVRVPIITAAKTELDWKPPAIDKTAFVIYAADTDEQPLLRPAPIMPRRADRSGHCIMAFDVTAEGTPFNIQAAQCSDTLFVRASEKAVAKWRYRPKVTDGQAVMRKGMRNKITFRLTDGAGRIIPE